MQRAALTCCPCGVSKQQLENGVLKVARAPFIPRDTQPARFLLNPPLIRSLFSATGSVFKHLNRCPPKSPKTACILRRNDFITIVAIMHVVRLCYTRFFPEVRLPRSLPWGALLEEACALLSHFFPLFDRSAQLPFNSLDLDLCRRAFVMIACVVCTLGKRGYWLSHPFSQRFFRLCCPVPVFGKPCFLLCFCVSVMADTDGASVLFQLRVCPNLAGQ